MNSRIASSALLLACHVLPAMAASPYVITPESYLAHIKFLASPALKGRLTGTPELNKAAEYLAAKFSQANLEPLAGSYFQDFEVTARTALGDNDKLTVSRGAHSRELKQGADFVPLNLSGNGKAGGAVVFAGYGITAPEYHYDDYSHLDAHDKVVVVLRHEPQENNEKSIFARKDLTQHAVFSSKIVNAKLHGAKAVLIVNDLPNHPGDTDGLARFEPLMATEDYGILVDQVSVSAVNELLAGSKENLQSLIGEIDRDLAPHSFALASDVSAALTVDLQQEKRTVHNVVGYLPGQTNEYVILGAHYDHLGLGQQNSLAPSQAGTVHAGADDNASGTAGVVELARRFASTGVHRRGFLFLCFAGEEEGLLGSAYYAGHPSRPVADAVAMINMDMIGRLKDNKLYIGGVATGSTFKPVVDEATQHAHFEADQSDVGGYGASDHTSFTGRHVPTLFFFSGLHGDYHKPSDTWDKINAKDAVRVLAEVSEIANTLADAPERPQFVRVAENPHSGAVSGGGGYGPYFGSIPDFGGPPHGVRFSDVREGSPAAQAGFKGGDVLVEFDGKPIDNLYDFTYALRQHKPGDKVKVKSLRDGTPVEADVVLTKRN
ncbi:MAG: M20/M25/M40 family metallo-hydrolase [Bryobacteraceae bacterium]